MSIKILLADDHQIMRDGLRTLLEQQPGIAVVGEANTGRLALQLARETWPDVVIMDISMPELNGIDATRLLIAELPAVKVLILSMHADRGFVTGAFRAGAAGFLLKDCTTEELVRAVHTVVAHQIYLTPRIAGVVMQDYVHRYPPSEVSAVSRLTGKEREVLQLIAEGWSTKGIAEHLHVSVKTVETHRRQIMVKLGLYSIAELTKYAIRAGLTSLDG
jgi:DNA-binding NarL/FixJ family response regulator